MIKKFFDAGTGEGDGGGPFNPFADAKAGDFTEPIVEKAEENIVDDRVPDEEDEPEEVVDTKPTKEEVKEPEKKEPEVKEPVEEIKAEEKKPEPVQFNLDEELKKLDKYEVMKKLGLDDWEIDLLKYKAETGDVTPYLEVKSVDYSKLSDEEMVKRQLKKEYGDLSPKAFEQLYKEEVTDKFILDAEIHGDAAAELGLARLKKEAAKLRESAIAEQAKFKAPEKKVDSSAQEKQQAYDRQLAEYKEQVTGSETTKALLKDKKLVFGNGESAFNYTVDSPQNLVDTVLNPQLIFNDLVDAKGQVDQVKFYKVKAYAANMDKIEQMLIDHGKTIGEKKYHEGLENPSTKEPKKAVNVEPELTGPQALAKYGKFKNTEN